MNAMVRRPYFLVLAAMVLLLSSVTGAQRKQVARPPQQQQQQTDQQQTQAQPDQQNVQQNQAAPVQSSLCANRPLCYEATDFVATVTEFRTSTDRYGNKVIDAMMHFQNKTNQPISLGYVDGSGSAIDDLGNRLGLNTYNGGVRGMGVVAGNNMDPKFTLAAGGGGDARFEMYWSPRNQLSGVTYEMELSLREMVRVEGNQWTLGDESLIHYQGLTNGVGVAPVSAGAGGIMNSGSGSGMGGVVPNNGFVQQNGGTVMAQPGVMGQANVAGAQPCPPGSSTGSTLTNVANTAGAQNQTANNAVANASNAISSLGSMFKKKKAAAAPTANAAVPCTPAANTGVAANGVMQTSPAAAPGTATANPAAASKTTVVGGRVVTTPVATPAVQRTSVVNTQRPAATTTTATPAVTRTALKQPAPATTKPAAAKKPATTTTTTNTTNATTNTGATK